MPCQVIYSQTKTTETKTYELWIVCVNCAVKEALPAVWNILACLWNVCWIRKISCGPYGAADLWPGGGLRETSEEGTCDCVINDTFNSQDCNTSHNCCSGLLQFDWLFGSDSKVTSADRRVHLFYPESVESNLLLQWCNFCTTVCKAAQSNTGIYVYRMWTSILKHGDQTSS